MSARSHTAISFAMRVNSRVCVSNSEFHLTRISSSVLPLSNEGGGPGFGGAADAPGAAVEGVVPAAGVADDVPGAADGNNDN